MIASLGHIMTAAAIAPHPSALASTQRICCAGVASCFSFRVRLCCHRAIVVHTWQSIVHARQSRRVPDVVRRTLKSGCSNRANCIGTMHTLLLLEVSERTCERHASLSWRGAVLPSYRRLLGTISVDVPLRPNSTFI